MKNIIRIALILLVASLLALKNCTKTTPTSQINTNSNASVPTATTNSTHSEIARNSAIPSKVYEVLNYVRANNQAPEGYEGGRHFGNFEGHLAKNDATGRRINYQEWDVNPHLSHKNRGVERLITGSNGTAYYTNDHYNTFVEVK